VSRKRFFPNLDALRFLAFLAVFITHVVTIASPAVLAHPYHQRLLTRCARSAIYR
jgi:peptidoglycan/LPS O-acetylase OafA/YrhL